MREIKFRGKRLENGEWVHGSLVSIHDTAIIVEDCDFSWDPDTDITAFWFDKKENEVDPATVGQYTGLKDKNGKEIYEGDIIECIGSDNKPIRHLVRYNDEKGGYSQLLFMGNGLACEPYDGGLISQNYICEMGKYIIGNIHDNTELLKTE